MGNSATKERSVSPDQPPASSMRRPGRSNGESSSHLGRLSALGSESYTARSSRSRHNLETSLFSLGTREHRERDREAEKAAKEARRKQREEERQRERERSRMEESIDGGFLVTHGVYSGTEDFKDRIVRHLMIQRRLSPFFKGLRDHDENWSDAQLYAAFHDLPIPGPDAEPPREEEPQPSTPTLGSSDSLTVPIATRSRSHSYASDTSNRSNNSTPSFGFSTARARAKTLSISSPKNPTAVANVAGPTEINDPSRFVDGRPIEAVLYKDAAECPICFLYYPPYLNRTRCCDQDICSECFVQIKRADPHIPENHDPPGTHSNQPEPSSIAEQLISEPACCPFCKQPDFGVTYTPPLWRRGISYGSQLGSSMASPVAAPPFSGSSSSTSLSAPASPPNSPGWKRRTMLPLGDPQVVTSDDIRPDWSIKLQTARSHAARRAAAATALHTAAFLMGNSEQQRPAGRSRFLRRAGASSESPSPTNRSGSGSPTTTTTTTTTTRSAPPPAEPTVQERLANIGFISSHDMGGGHERRSRIVDLEEMMLMEAIRQSLAEEEERKRKEEREREKGKGKEPVAHDNHRNGEASGSAQTGEDGSLDGFRNLAQIVVADKDAQTTEHVEDAEGSEGKGVAVSVGGVVGVEETR